MVVVWKKQAETADKVTASLSTSDPDAPPMKLEDLEGHLNALKEMFIQKQGNLSTQLYLPARRLSCNLFLFGIPGLPCSPIIGGVFLSVVMLKDVTVLRELLVNLRPAHAIIVAHLQCVDTHRLAHCRRAFPRLLCCWPGGDPGFHPQPELLRCI